ncbi:MAG: thioredoxin family protein [Planctomycetota bacterium]
MARTESTMLELGTTCPDFSLPCAVTGNTVSRSDLAGRPVLAMFICNHCPFVKHLLDGLTSFASEYSEKLAIVAISPNDVANYPDDSPEKMKELAHQLGWSFPYLYDESQEVAKSFKAACTPDFFLFDAGHTLVYRGQFDESRPDSGTPVTGTDLRAAADAVLAGQSPSAEQRPSIGCNIKWIKGNEPAYFAAV